MSMRTNAKDYSHIREATPNDLEEILAIYNEAILTTTAIYEYDPFDRSYIETWWNQRITNGWPVIIAEYDGQVAGFATYGTFRARAAYQSTCEHSVYVKEIYRGKGIGRMLLRAIIDAARKNRVHVLIGGIDAQNQLSISLHESEGFTIAGHLHEVAYKFNRWLDLVFLEKKL